jgi:hypothetical protein
MGRPQASAAMVAAQIIKSGDGAKGWEDKCKKILAEIKGLCYGTYSQVSAQRQKENKEARDNGEREPREGEQSEHFVTNSNCVQGSGRNGPAVPGLGNYTEANGFAYSIEDDQITGTEHKWATDSARASSEASAAAGKTPNLSDSLQEGQDRAETIFNGEHEPGAKSKVRDKKGRTKKQKKQIAKAAAICLRLMAEKNFRDNGAVGDPKLQNGYHKTPAKPKPKKKPKKKPKGRRPGRKSR